MFSTLHTSARAALVAALIGGSALAVPPALGFRSGTGVSTEDVRLPFAATLAGVSGASSVWEGQVRGQPGGRARLTLRQVEDPLEAAQPVWHVDAVWTFEGESTAHSFTAELEGMVDWKTGATHLSGAVTSGWRQGTWVQAISQFVDGDIAGTLAFEPMVAAR